MKNYNEYLTECIKTSGLMIIDMAEDIAGKTDRITNLNISVDFKQETMSSIPEITITRSHCPSYEDIERLFDIRTEFMKKGE